MADVVAERSVAEGLVDALERRRRGRRVLVARAEEARDTLPGRPACRRRRAVDVVPLYRTVAEVPPGRGRARRRPGHVHVVLDRAGLRDRVPGRDLAAVRGVSIGPVTTGTMRELGIPIVTEADQHDLDGLIAAVIVAAAQR